MAPQHIDVFNCCYLLVNPEICDCVWYINYPNNEVDDYHCGQTKFEIDVIPSPGELL